MLHRRDFLVRGGTASVLAGLGSTLRAEEPATPSFPGMITRMTEPENLEFPFSSLSSSITPNEHFYIRSHFAVPKIDMKSWKLTVEGAVKQKLDLSYDDLLKLPTRAMKATLECAGNGRVHLVPTANGVQWGQGAVSNAEWSGIPLAAILDKAGLGDKALEVILEGADRGQINSDPKSPGPISFSRSISIEKAKDSSVLLAFKMNGKDLPSSHGYPLRAVVGGWYGMASVKWLSRIIVSEQPYRGFFQTLDYAYWERKDALPTLTPITKMEVKSSIARPASAEVIPAGKPYRVFGAAWTGDGTIAKVEVSTDGGTNWAAAKLIEKPQAYSWCLWEYGWNVPAAAGAVTIMARATDSDGNTQPMQRDINRRNYMISHVTPIRVLVR